MRAPSACALRQLLTRALLCPQVAIEAGKVALVLVILDLLRITKDRPWFEARLLCCQASVPCVLTPHAAKRSTSTSFRSRPCSSTALAATGGSACPRIGYRGPPARADQRLSHPQANSCADPLPDAHDRLSSDRCGATRSILFCMLSPARKHSVARLTLSQGHCDTQSAAALQGRSRATAAYHGAAGPAGRGAGAGGRSAVRLVRDRGAFAGSPGAGRRAGRDARLVADGGAHRRVRGAVRIAGCAAQAARGRVVPRSQRDGDGRRQAHRHGRAVALRGVTVAQRHAASGARSRKRRCAIPKTPRFGGAEACCVHAHR